MSVAKFSAELGSAGQTGTSAPTWERCLLGGANSKRDLRIQAADLIAREAMKALDNFIGPKKRTILLHTQTKPCSRYSFGQAIDLTAKQAVFPESADIAYYTAFT